MRITDPGKFEGQEDYVPYFWEQGLDGGPDYTFASQSGFKVTAADKAKFPQLRLNSTVWLRETDQGFVEES